MAPSTNGALQAQMDALKEQVGSGFADLKGMLMRFDERLETLSGRVAQVEQREAVCQPMVTARLAATEKRLDAHENRLEAMEVLIQELVQTNKILRWLLGGITVLLTTGMIAFATRLVEVMLP